MGDESIRWAKEHKKEIAEELIRSSGVQRSERPAAIFMAGLPGSGKTEFTKNWLENSQLKVMRLDMDEIASKMETYSPEKADEFRGGASLILNYVFDKIINGRYDFIMDGTFGGGVAVQNIERVLKRGYHVKIFYIYQVPKVAWQYTVAREKVEHRSIKLEGFLDTYYKTLENLKRLKDVAPNKMSVDVIIKNERNEIVDIKSNLNVKDIDKVVNVEYNKDKLRKEIL